MVVETWHGEGPGKSFYAVAQFGDASHCLWVLKKEVLEVLELSCLFLDVQGNLEALVHELDNLHKVSFFELSGGQGWSTKPEATRSQGTLVPGAGVLIGSD